MANVESMQMFVLVAALLGAFVLVLIGAVLLLAAAVAPLAYMGKRLLDRQEALTAESAKNQQFASELHLSLVREAMAARDALSREVLHAGRNPNWGTPAAAPAAPAEAPQNGAMRRGFLAGVTAPNGTEPEDAYLIRHGEYLGGEPDL